MLTKRIKYENLLPGDIILTARKNLIAKTVRFFSSGDVSHAMICVQYGSVIDSTSDGVQARNIQYELFGDGEDVFVFRLRNPLSPVTVAKITDYARSETGARYSTKEAMKSVLSVSKPRTKKQFCSRLVAQAYAHAGINLVADQDYCTPQELRESPLLYELPDLIETVTADDAAVISAMQEVSFIPRMHESQNQILDVARSLDATVEKFQDIDILVRDHPEWDSKIARAYVDSGFLDIWKYEFFKHQYRYDIAEMEAMHTPERAPSLRDYCIATICETYTGGLRFATNLYGYRRMQEQHPRETYKLLIALYEILVRNDQQRSVVARSWLLRHHPEDVTLHMEKVEPHSELWFSIVDRVEPRLGILARSAIASEQSSEVCSSCGDTPVRDYRVTNAAKDMPGVPSLRLCEDCILIRRGFGEKLDPVN